VPIPFGRAYLEETFNLGEEYEKLPRFIPYAILPFGVALMLFRILQATMGVIRGRRASLIVSHEAEEAVQEAAATLKAEK
jgi:C4-dicarboxylate transporter DctQ subunit